MGLDARIGGQFLKAGLGYGGSVSKGRASVHPFVSKVGVDFDHFESHRARQQARIDRFFEKIHQALWVGERQARGCVSACFKANTDEYSLAPALEVVKRLLEEGAWCTPQIRKGCPHQGPLSQVALS